jgi:hypothetical protein
VPPDLPVSSYAVQEHDGATVASLVERDLHFTRN